MLPSIPGLFAVSSIEMEATEIKKGCYNDRVVLLGLSSILGASTSLLSLFSRWKWRPLI
jgi:hypothetical protein